MAAVYWGRFDTSFRGLDVGPGGVPFRLKIPARRLQLATTWMVTVRRGLGKQREKVLARLAKPRSFNENSFR